MDKRLASVPVLFLLFSALLAACGRPKVDLPDRRVAISQEAAQHFEDKVRFLKATENGEFKLTVTEEELTSYLNLKVEQESLPIRRPTIWLSAGKVYVRGDFQGRGFPVKGEATFVIAVAIEDGTLNFRAEKAIIGPLPVPNPLLREISDLVNERVGSALGSIGIRQLQILEGEAIIVLIP